MYRDVIAYTDEVGLEYHAYMDDFAARYAGDARLKPDFSRRNVAALAALIAERRDARAPFSLVRYGDGEGACLLTREERFAALYRPVLGRTLALHFGVQDYDDADFMFWRRAVADAAETADVLACSSMAVCESVVAARSADIRGSVGTLSAAAYVIEHRAGIAARLFEGWHAHVALLPHYAELFRGATVLLVTCYGPDFVDLFARGFECAKVDAIRIPGQAVIEGKAMGRPLYPDHLARVEDEVGRAAGAGIMCVIAAGPAGKRLCAIAAGQGAVALDVGSVMDVWRGRGVRPYHSSEFVETNRL